VHLQYSPGSTLTLTFKSETDQAQHKSGTCAIRVNPCECKTVNVFITRNEVSY